jgi:hypothetical protein
MLSGLAITQQQGFADLVNQAKQQQTSKSQIA